MTSAPGRNTECDRLAAVAASHLAAGRPADAEASYRLALALNPRHPALLHNLGVIAASQHHHLAAVAWFDAAIAEEPRYAAAWYHRALVIETLGRRAEATAGLARAASLDPGHYETHRRLGFLYLAEGHRGRALDHFARTYELRRGDDRTAIAAQSLTHASRTKLLHDAEQLRHLARNHRDGARFQAMARDYEAVGHRFPETITKLSRSDVALLGESYNRAISVRDAPELPEATAAARPDRQPVVEAVRNGTGVAWFDDFLTPRAFASLRRYLLESTIWHDFSHIGGFVASYLEDGLACPLLLQIADELRSAFPELLRDRPLSQAWSFMAVTPSAAIDAHSDDGAFSVNFWMTPTIANAVPDQGGMGICLVPPPLDWPMTGYEADRKRAVIFLEQQRGNIRIVPYRENRAAIFRSRLLHYSDRPQFAEGFENHRINVTLVFGSGDRDQPNSMPPGS